MRQHGDDHLGFIAPAVDEQRTDRTVDQAGDQRLLFGRTALALEIAAGNAARGVGLFLIVHGQRQEVDAFARRLGGHDSGEHDGLAIGRHHGAVGLTGNLAGFQLKGTSAPVDLDCMLIEHFGLLSCFRRKHGCLKRKDHAQDGEMLIANRDQHPAILPWSLNFGWRPSFRVFKGISPPPSGRIAAGRSCA